jgi:hypothetical protein
LIDVIVKEVEATNHPDSQGATDADNQAEKDQAKEWGVGAIHGLRLDDLKNIYNNRSTK